MFDETLNYTGNLTNDFNEHKNMKQTSIILFGLQSRTGYRKYKRLTAIFSTPGFL